MNTDLFICAGSSFKAKNVKITVRMPLPTVVPSRGEEKHPKQEFTTTTHFPTRKLSFWKSKKSEFKFKVRGCSNIRKQVSWHIHLCVQLNDLIRHRNKSKQWKTNYSKSGTSYWPSRPTEHTVSGSTSRMCIKHQLLSLKANIFYIINWNLITKANISPYESAPSLTCVTTFIYKQVQCTGDPQGCMCIVPSPAFGHLNHVRVTLPAPYKYPPQLERGYILIFILTVQQYLQHTDFKITDTCIPKDHNSWCYDPLRKCAGIFLFGGKCLI